MQKTNYKMRAHPLRDSDLKFRKSYLKGLTMVVLPEKVSEENDLLILKVLINTLNLESDFLDECLKFRYSNNKAEIEEVKNILKSNKVCLPFLIDSFLIGYCNNGISEEGQNVVETLVKMFDCSETFYGLGRSLSKLSEDKLEHIFNHVEE